MNFFKMTGIFIGIVSLCLVGYNLLPEDIEVEKDSVIEHLQARDLAKAESALEKYRKVIPFSKWSLYKGYIERAKGNIEASNKVLSQALVNDSKSTDISTVNEIYLNLMLNAYLEQDRESLSLHISQGRNLLAPGHQNWLNLFRGIEAYLKGNFAEAASYVSVGQDRQYLSPLMQSDFEVHFPNYWTALFLARCQIAVGDIEAGRKSIEIASKSMPDEGQEEIHFLLGLCYSKDAESKGFRAAVPYYKLALGHFKKVDIADERYDFEREEILIKVWQNIEEILNERSFDDLSFYSVLLAKLGAKDEMERLKDKLVILIREETISESWDNVEDLAKALSGVLESGELRDGLRKQFEENFERSLNNTDIENMYNHWTIAALFSDNTAQLREKYTGKVLESGIEIINQDALPLMETEVYINFLDEFEPDREKRKRISEELLEHGKRLWEKKRTRNKAVAFLKVLKESALAKSCPHLRENLENSFRDAYRNAEKYDNINKLKDIMETANALELKNIGLKRTEEQANQLEDAVYLFKNKKYLQAKKKAKWVLNLDPDNVSAKEILGLIAYDEAEYETAYSYLKDIDSSKKDIARDIAVTYILAEDAENGTKLLNDLKEQDSLDEGTALELAFGALIQNKPLMAMKWLEKVDQNKPEVLAGRVFASFEMDSWNETIDLFRDLQKPYKSLDGYKGIVIESYTSVGDISRAEEMLEDLLKSPPETSESQFPIYFQRFKKKKLDNWNRYYVAAQFYRIVKGDDDKALEFYNRIENPSPIAEIEKAEIYLEKGDLYKAKTILLNVLDNVKGTDAERKIKLRLLPHLAEITTRLGFYPEAIPIYQEYFSLDPDDVSFRIPFAKVLMVIKRYDLALEQFRIFQKSEALSDMNMVDYIETLVRTNKFDEANNVARDWISTRKVPLVYQIKVARLLIITKYKALIDTIFAAIAEKEIRTLEEKQQLILLWMDLGDYEDSVSLARVAQRELETTVDGLLVLVELYIHLSQDEKALEFAEQASIIAPTDPRVIDIIEKYQRNPSVIARSTKLLKDRLEDDPESITLRLDYAKNLIDLSIETYLAGGMEDIRQSYDLNNAKSMLEKLSKQDQEVPETFFLLGKVYYLLDRNDEAAKAYEKALQLDVSYVNAYQYYGLIFEENEDLDNAVEMVRSGAKFDPNNAEVWMQLGGLLVAQEKYDDALNALKNAIRYAPNNPNPYIKIASVYLTLNNAEFAIANLEKALELSPKNIEAIKLMLLSLYNEDYVKGTKDKDDLERRQIRYFDKLQAFSPEDAKELREKLGVSFD